MSMYLLLISWEKKHSESYSNDIVFLCCYHYSCGMEFSILIEVE